jgi:hypothetical protein
MMIVENPLVSSEINAIDPRFSETVVENKKDNEEIKQRLTRLHSVSRIFSSKAKSRDSIDALKQTNKLPSPFKGLTTFNDLPSELYHIILSYYTLSFRGLLHFATINKVCKHISDYSLLWLSCNLSFYAPRIYWIAHNIITKNDNRKISELANSSSNYTKCHLEIFMNETRFPPVYHVIINSTIVVSDLIADNYEVDLPPCHSIASTSVLRYQLAHKVRNWFLPLYLEYNALWNWNGYYRPYLVSYCDWIKVLEEYFTSVIGFTTALFTVCIYFFSSFPSLSSFSFQNSLGFMLILFCLFLYLFCIFAFMIDEVFSRIIHNYYTLKKLFDYGTLGTIIYGLDSIAGLLMGLIIIVSLVYCKCLGLIPSAWSWMIIPFWISIIAALIRWFKELWTDGGKDFVIVSLTFMFIYAANAIPFSCLLVSLYYDNILSDMNLGYALVPLYPVFLVMFLLTLVRIFYVSLVEIALCNGSVYYYNSCYQKVIMVFVNMLGTILAFLINFCVIMLSISLFNIENDNDTWDKDTLGIHFSPLTLVLLFVISIQSFLLVMYYEDKNGYLFIS